MLLLGICDWGVGWMNSAADKVTSNPYSQGMRFLETRSQQHYGMLSTSFTLKHWSSVCLYLTEDNLMNCLLIYGAHLCRPRAKIAFGEAKGLYKTCWCTEKGQVCGNKSICYIALLLETGYILFQYIPTLLVWHSFEYLRFLSNIDDLVFVLQDSASWPTCEHEEIWCNGTWNWWAWWWHRKRFFWWPLLVATKSSSCFG